jgi:hypothetical protein
VPSVIKRTTAERFWSKVDKQGPDGCWLWLIGKSTAGYGVFRLPDRQVLAHRFAYELLVGPIPDGMTLDHLCRVRHCVNPTHLEPATRGENTLRGETVTAANRAKTHCPQGHPYEQTYGQRICRKCRRKANREYMRRAYWARHHPPTETGGTLP